MIGDDFPRRVFWGWRDAHDERGGFGVLETNMTSHSPQPHRLLHLPRQPDGAKGRSQAQAAADPRPLGRPLGASGKGARQGGGEGQDDAKGTGEQARRWKGWRHGGSVGGGSGGGGGGGGTGRKGWRHRPRKQRRRSKAAEDAKVGEQEARKAEQRGGGSVRRERRCGDTGAL